MKTPELANWQVELWTEALDIIENIAVVNGYEPDDMSGIAIAAALASLVDQSYSIGLCIGATTREERMDRHCFRNQN